MRNQLVSRPAGIHLILADSWSKEWGQPQLVDSFRTRNKHIDCFEITDVEWKASSRRRLFAQVLKYFLKGGPIRCFRMAARYARAAFSEIQATFSEDHFTAPSPPVSCAAMLARKMGASDRCQLSPVMGPPIFGQDGPLPAMAESELLPKNERRKASARMTRKARYAPPLPGGDALELGNYLR